MSRGLIKSGCTYTVQYSYNHDVALKENVHLDHRYIIYTVSVILYTMYPSTKQVRNHYI